MNQGIVTGYSDGTFRPDQAVSRQEAAALLFATLKGIQSMEPVESTPSQDIPVRSQDTPTQEQKSPSVSPVPAQPIFYTDLETELGKGADSGIGSAWDWIAGRQWLFLPGTSFDKGRRSHSDRTGLAAESHLFPYYRYISANSDIF